MSLRSLLFCFLTSMCVGVSAVGIAAEETDLTAMNGYVEPTPEALHITSKIDKLEKQKRALQARANNAGREAQRLLFIDWTGYRYQLRRETELRQQVKVLEAEIDALTKERIKLQKPVR